MKHLIVVLFVAITLHGFSQIIEVKYGDPVSNAKPTFSGIRLTGDITGTVGILQKDTLHNPGNWSMTTYYHTEWTRVGLNGKHRITDKQTFVIFCDDHVHKMYFIQVDTVKNSAGKVVRVDKDSTDIMYDKIEVWPDDDRYQKGSYYYLTGDRQGIIEYRPGEMVTRKVPDEFVLEYLKYLPQNNKFKK